MKFSESPIIELPVGNAVLSIEQNNQSMHVGTSVWPCSLVLVKFAERWSTNSQSPNPYTSILDFNHKRGIELGSGCGAGGMGLYLLGLHDVILTDIAPVMPALKRNLKHNKPILKKSLKASQLYWANSGQIESHLKIRGQFDVVFAADVVYIENTVKPLVDTMLALVADDGVVLFGYQIRSIEAHELFWDLVVRVFSVEKVPHEDLHPDYAFDDADVYVFRKICSAATGSGSGLVA